MRIGVDVGGTNTDAVLMNGRRVVALCKQPTSENISDGIVAAIGAVLAQSGVAPQCIRCTMIGTTQFTNAFVERRGMQPVGVIRIALPSTTAVPPLLDWPADARETIGDHCYLVGGGYRYDGRVDSHLDEGALRTAARALCRAGVSSVAISCVFSPLNAEMEQRAQAIMRSEIPGAAISLSSQIGSIGLLARENAAVMNASLAALSQRIVRSFRDALRRLDIDSPFYISQNDGTLLGADDVERYPVLTFASGPTNSMRGAAYLSGIDQAIVADIGGTTTDIGMLVNGFPRESAMTADIGGVRTNFRMPDVLALGLGGGSRVRNGRLVTVGPDSVGYRLTQDAQVFGGETLTASDIACAAGYVELGDCRRVADLPAKFVSDAVAEIHAQIAEGVDKIRTSATPLPLILVGGGSVLVRDPIPGVAQVITPEHAAVANAIGAAIAQVGGEIDRVYAYDTEGRDAVLAAARQTARDRAVAAGAEPDSVEIVDIEELPLAYVPGGAVRVRVKAAGDLALDNAEPVVNSNIQR